MVIERRLSLALLLFLTLFLGACIETESDITGSVMGSSFEVLSGSAESIGDGAYIITLADTAEFSCTSVASPPETYLTVVIAEIDEPATYQAAEVVSFNAVENSVGNVEQATSGTVVIEAIDPTSISGSIDASNGSSSVTGSFTVEICQ